MSFLDGMMENKKKFFVQLGVIGVCLAGAVVLYVVLSDPQSPTSPLDQAAEKRLEQIAEPMRQDAANQIPVEEPPRAARRGMIPYQDGR